jgi:hypothetical protein
MIPPVQGMPRSYQAPAAAANIGKQGVCWSVPSPDPAIFTRARKATSLSYNADESSTVRREEIMKSIVFAAILSLVAGSAYADSCKATAGMKKLSGAAMNSFMTKCETDAKAGCDKTAAEKKLSGAAKDSFTKKCVSDATG